MKDREIVRGRVVKSKAGRDKSRFLVVYYYDGSDHALVVDGDLRKIERPKKKKLIHLQATAALLPEESMATDASIRRSLKDMGFVPA